MSIVDKAMRRGGFCAAYGARMLKHGPVDYRMLCRESETSETTFHRTTYISAGFRGSVTEESSDASWIAVQGHESICFVTWNIAGENSKEPDLTKLFCYPVVPFKEPQVKVSSKLGTNEVSSGNGIAASFAEYNEIAVVYYLRKKLREHPHSTYDETLEVAIDVFGRLFPVSIKANEIKVFVLRKGEQNMKLLAIEKVEALLDDRKRTLLSESQS